MSDFLLLGHNGYLGSYILNNLDCHILNERNIYNNGQHYQYVINCIGKANLEYCETNADETNYSNALVIEDIKKFYPKSKIINFSSYYVYDDAGLCAENSKTTDKYQYCKQKLLGEKLNSNGLNLRIGKLFGNPFSDQNKLTEHIIKNENLKIDEILFNPTSTQSVVNLLKNKHFIENQIGVFNFANDGVTSHYHYAEFIIKYMGLNKNLYKITKLDRCFDNYGNFLMSLDKIKEFQILNSWQYDLLKYLDNYND